jgi:hypothetical protein
MSTARLVLGSLLVVALGPATAAAQERAASTPTPFHAGQWAMQGDIGGPFTVGLLRFRAPTSALVLALGGALSRQTRENPNGTGGSVEESAWAGGFNSSVGLRHYRPVTSAVALFNTFGLSGNYQRYFQSWNLSGGPFLDLGGQYLFGERFSVGVSSALSLSYVYNRYGSSPYQNDRALTLQAGATRVSATVYF